MQCAIPNRSIKLFVKIIQCLSKIGDYVNFEVQQDKLILRTISESRSCFVSFTLDKSFYKEYKLTSEIGSLRVPLKPCLAVFRNINSIETCVMSIDLKDSKLIFDIAAQLGIKRVYKLFLEDSFSSRAQYNRNFPNKLVFKPGPMLEALQNNFQSNLEEITMEISPEYVKIRSYIDENRSNANKLLRTELTVSHQEFLEYSVRNTAVELTFCLKEMKAILNFCETSGQPVTFLYDAPGKPILLVLQFFNVLEADFVLATLLEQDQASSQQSVADAHDVGQFTSSNPRNSSSPSSSMPTSSISSSIPSSSMPSSISHLLSKEDPYAIPSSLQDIKFNPDDLDFASGHVSGSDDESIPIHKIDVPDKRRKRPVFSTDFQTFSDDEASDNEPMSDI